MRDQLTIPHYILEIPPYKAGKPLEELEREYGIQGSIKLASNENPLGPSPNALQAIQQALGRLHRYPDSNGYYLTGKLADKLNVPPEQIVLGNGSDDIIGMLTQALLAPGDEAILPSPAFLMYEIMVRAVGALPVKVPLDDLQIDLKAMEQHINEQTRMVFVTNPNNPTGMIITQKPFETFLASLPPQVLVVVDEAYIEFASHPDCAQGVHYLSGRPPVVTLRTFSKAYGLAGLRIGYGIMPQTVADLLHRVRQPFNTNSLAQIGAMAALDDQPFLEQTLRVVREGLQQLYQGLDRMGLRYFPSQANFLMIDVARDANEIFESLLFKGVIVRSMSAYGYPQYIRVNAGLPEENQRFLTSLEQILK